MNPGRNYEFNFTLPQGPTGPTGPLGPIDIRNAYFATFNNGTVANGIPVPENDRLPIDRQEVNSTNIVTLDTANETIQFNETGFFKITFTVCAYIVPNGQGFDPSTDFISIGFRKVNTDNVYIGGSIYNTNEISSLIIGQGILSIDNTTDLYELANLCKRDIYLRTPKIGDTHSQSYFASPVVTIVIEYLGK